jgi:hypothetical protein
MQRTSEWARFDIGLWHSTDQIEPMKSDTIEPTLKKDENQMKKPRDRDRESRWEPGEKATVQVLGSGRRTCHSRPPLSSRIRLDANAIIDG